MPYLSECEYSGVSQVELTTWDDAIKFSKHPDSFIIGYPPVNRLCDVLCAKYGKESESCVCFPSYTVAKRCREYVRLKSGAKVRILQLATSKPRTETEKDWKIESRIAAIFVNERYFPMVRDYLVLCGEAVSNCLAWYVLRELFMIEKDIKKVGTGEDEGEEGEEEGEGAFIEARFGRNLNAEFGPSSGFVHVDQARRLVKRRLARIILDTIHPEEEDNDNDDDESDAGLFSDPLSQWRLDFVDNENENARNIDSAHSVVPGEPINSLTLELSDEGNNREPSFGEDPGNGVQSGTNSRTSETNSNVLTLDISADIYLHNSGAAALHTALRILLQYDQHRVDRSRSNNSSCSSLNLAAQNAPIYKKNAIFSRTNPNSVRMLEEFSTVHFLPEGNTQAMHHLKHILQSGEQLLGVFVEVPSEPYWQCANIPELKRLSEMYGFFVIIDTDISDMVNIDVLEYADIMAISLGEHGGGTLVLNPKSRLYKFARDFMNAGAENYEENLWAGDILLLERASRRIVKRSSRINSTAEYIVNEVLLPQEGNLFKKVYYPGIPTVYRDENGDDSNTNYEAIRCKSFGGCGGKISLTFTELDMARSFYDTLNVGKHPVRKSDTTNAIPYTVVEHALINSVSKHGGVDPTLVQLCIGLEDKTELRSAFDKAIESALSVRSCEGGISDKKLGC